MTTRLVGLTGGIATGKSTVATLLAHHGAAIVDADCLARAIVEPGRPALEEIAAAFGAHMLDAQGRLDRPRLATLVFGDAAARQRLEAITHPRIAALMAERTSAALATASPVVVLDIPLLYENGRETLVEGVLVVWTDERTQRTRLLQRDGIDESEASRRLDAQWPIDEKRQRATWIIDNTRTREDTAAQVAQWWAGIVGGGRA